MKKQIKSLVVFVTIFTLSFSNVFAGVNSVEVKSNDEITTVLNKKAKRFVKNNAKDLELYLSVMDMYENAPAKFYNLDKETQNNFLAVTAQLSDKMTSVRKKDIKKLAVNLEFNSAVSKFIWAEKDSHKVIVPLVLNTEEIQKSI